MTRPLRLPRNSWARVMVPRKNKTAARTHRRRDILGPLSLRIATGHSIQHDQVGPNSGFSRWQRPHRYERKPIGTSSLRPAANPQCIQTFVNERSWTRGAKRESNVNAQPYKESFKPVQRSRNLLPIFKNNLTALNDHSGNRPSQRMRRG